MNTIICVAAIVAVATAANYEAEDANIPLVQVTPHNVIYGRISALEDKCGNNINTYDIVCIYCRAGLCNTDAFTRGKRINIRHVSDPPSCINGVSLLTNLLPNVGCDAGMRQIQIGFEDNWMGK